MRTDLHVKHVERAMERIRARLSKYSLDGLKRLSRDSGISLKTLMAIRGEETKNAMLSTALLLSEALHTTVSEMVEPERVMTNASVRIQIRRALRRPTRPSRARRRAA